MPTMKVWNGASWDVIGGVPGSQGAQGSAGPGGGNFNLTLSGNTSGAMAQVSSGTLTLAGGNNITLSQAGNAITIVGPATASTPVTGSLWYEIYNVSWAAISQSSLQLYPIKFEKWQTAVEFDWLMSMTSATQASSAALSVNVMLYSYANSTSINSVSSGSTQYTWTSGAGAASNWGGVSNAANAFRQWSCPLNMLASPGDYVVGFLIRTGNGMVTASLLGEHTLSFAGWAGAVTATSQKELPFAGVYSAATASPPTAIAAGNVIGTGMAGRRIDMAFRALGA